MKKSIPFWPSLVLVLALAPCLPASECASTPCATAEKSIKASVSTFKVPGLDKAATKKLVKELAKVPGVLAAKAAPDAATLAVTFEQSKTTAGRIGAVIQSLAPGAELTGTAAAASRAPSEPGCASCPSRAGCPRGGQ